MMSKLKKSLITAGIFIVVGISGSIVSGFYMVPQIAEEVYRVQREIKNATPIEREVFITEEAVNELDIEVLEESGFYVEIKPSIDNKTRIKVYEYLQENINVNVDYNSESKKLIIRGERTIQDLFNAENLKSLFERAYTSIIGTWMEESNEKSQIVIEVPEGVDITFKGNYNNNLIINDKSVLKDNLFYLCKNGYVDLPFNNNLKNIHIRTEAYLEMDVMEIINADKVILDASSINIISKDYNNIYDSISKLPESVTINGYDIQVTSFIPLGKNVILSGDYVSYNSNFEAYPVNLQLRGRIGSEYYYENSEDSSFHGAPDKENYDGVLGGDENTEYNLLINKYYKCDIENLSKLEIEAEFN